MEDDYLGLSDKMRILIQTQEKFLNIVTRPDLMVGPTIWQLNCELIRAVERGTD